MQSKDASLQLRRREPDSGAQLTLESARPRFSCRVKNELQGSHSANLGSKFKKNIFAERQVEDVPAESFIVRSLKRQPR